MEKNKWKKETFKKVANKRQTYGIQARRTVDRKEETNKHTKKERHKWRKKETK